VSSAVFTSSGNWFQSFITLSVKKCLLTSRRVSEWKKILSGNFGGPLTLKMIEVGLAPYVGLPEDPNIEEMERVWNEIQVNIHSRTADNECPS
jgi:hypothetical protein